MNVQISRLYQGTSGHNPATCFVNPFINGYANWQCACLRRHLHVIFLTLRRLGIFEIRILWTEWDRILKVVAFTTLLHIYNISKPRQNRLINKKVIKKTCVQIPLVTPLFALELRFVGFGITVSLGRLLPNFVDLYSNLTKIANILNDICAPRVMFDA